MEVTKIGCAHEIIPAEEIPLDEQAQVFTNAFEGYVGGTFEMNAASLARFLSAQAIDLCYSRFVRSGYNLLGFAYVNRTGDLARLASMGTVSSARRRGVGALLATTICEEASQRGDTAVMLEVIEQNPAAHQLYYQAGFRSQTRLLGWRRPPQSQPSEFVAEGLEACSMTEVLNSPASFEYPILPWQLSRHALAKLERPHAYRLGGNYIVLTFPTANSIRIHALSSGAEQMDWMGLRQMLTTLLRQYSDYCFFAPPLFPQEFGTLVFQPLGFSADPLSQLLMRADISQGSPRTSNSEERR